MILDDIVKKVKIRVEEDKKETSMETIKELAGKIKSKLSPYAFEIALQDKDIGFICEVKKASPSKGIIAEDFPYVDIARDYERAGASCISVLTEPDFFCGKDIYLTHIKQIVNIPVIRKDFVIDPYQIYQAKVVGADAVLLICAILDEDTLSKYIEISNELGLSALVEAHDEDEVDMAIRAGARLIGVNNRNLKDFTVNIDNSISLRKKVPEGITFVAESGIKTAQDIKALKKANVNGVLIGEILMRAENKTRQLNILRGPKIKICGLKSKEDIAIANRVKPDYIGFVFARSKRQITDELARELKGLLDKDIQAVGVFVNDVIDHIVWLANENIIDVIQLHGDEDEAYVKRLKTLTSKKIIKAIRVKEELDIKKINDYPSDYLLLDSYIEGAYGGTGKKLDTQLIPGSVRPLFLAGGVDIDNVENLIHKYNPYGIDVSSSVEVSGTKNYDKVREIVEKVRDCYGE